MTQWTVKSHKSGAHLLDLRFRDSLDRFPEALEFSVVGSVAFCGPVYIFLEIRSKR